MLEASFIAEQYERHAASVFRVCLRFAAGDRAFAEDVTHDVFVRLLENSEGLSGGNVDGWLRTVAYRCCIDRVRRDRTLWGRIARLLSARTTSTPSHEAAVDARCTLDGIARTVRMLPGLERAVFMMRYLDNMEQQRIAELLELSKGYVSKLLDRARSRIQDAGWEVGDE